jgi:hypothetical protein
MINLRYPFRAPYAAGCALAFLLVVNPTCAQESTATASVTTAEQAMPESNPSRPEAVPLTPEKMPPNKPSVIYQGGLLKIDAFNSTLADILSMIAALTGVEIDVPAGAKRERVVAQLGPGPAREILASLLGDSSFDYVISAQSNDPQAIGSVVLMPRGTKGASPRTVAVAEQRPPRMEDRGSEPVTPAESDLPSSSRVNQNQKETEPPATPEESAAATPNSDVPMSEATGPTVTREQSNVPPTSPLPVPDVNNHNGMVQQLQQMYQQRQQQMQELKGTAQHNP